MKKSSKIILSMILTLALTLGASIGAISVSASESTEPVAPVTYNYEKGSTVLVNNAYNGAIISDMDAINVNALQKARTYGKANGYVYANGGVTLTGINANGEGKYLVLNLQNVLPAAKAISVLVNGVAMSESVHYIDSQFGAMQEVAAATTVSLPVYKNAIVTKASIGFFGQVVVPVSAFEGVTAIESVTVSMPLAQTCVNVGEVALADFNAETLELSNLTSIWTVGEANWEKYTTTLAELEGVEVTWDEIFKLTKMAAGEWYFENAYAQKNIDNFDSGAAETVAAARPTYYMQFPSSMIAEDGLVHLKDLGVKGLAIDVELPATAPSLQLAIRMGGENNATLDYKDSVVVYQTSNSKPNQRRILPSGLVKGGNTSYLPSGGDVSKCTIYIPFTADSFTGHFGGVDPDVVVPVIYLDYNNKVFGHTLKFTNFKFVTDDSAYAPHLITLVSANGLLNGYIGEVAIGSNSNNKVLAGTTANFEVIPNKGYEVTSVTVTDENGNSSNVEVSANGKFDYVVNGPITVMANYAISNYEVTYVLNGGENHEDNEASYTFLKGFVLEAPVKEGSEFLGWYDNAEFEGEPITEIEDGSTGSITLYAKWLDPVVPDSSSQAPTDSSSTIQGGTSEVSGCQSSIGGLGVMACALVASVAVVAIKKGKKDE